VKASRKHPLSLCSSYTMPHFHSSSATFCVDDEEMANVKGELGWWEVESLWGKRESRREYCCQTLCPLSNHFKLLIFTLFPIVLVSKGTRRHVKGKTKKPPQQFSVLLTSLDNDVWNHKTFLYFVSQHPKSFSIL
jgi:hypothetical protein